MGARTSLNTIHLTIALLGAATLGWLTGSWFIFLVSFAVLVAAKIHSKAIRPNRRRSR